MLTSSEYRLHVGGYTWDGPRRTRNVLPVTLRGWRAAVKATSDSINKPPKIHTILADQWIDAERTHWCDLLFDLMCYPPSLQVSVEELVTARKKAFACLRYWAQL